MPSKGVENLPQFLEFLLALVQFALIEEVLGSGSGEDGTDGAVFFELSWQGVVLFRTVKAWRGRHTYVRRGAEVLDESGLLGGEGGVGVNCLHLKERLQK